MATRAIIAVANNDCLSDGWKGRYAHWDNYPERMVGVLGALVARDGYDKVIQTLIHDNLSWSSIDYDTARFCDEMWGDDYRRNIVDGYGVVHDDIEDDDMAWYDDETGAYSWACYVYVLTTHGVEVNTVESDSEGRETVVPSAFHLWSEIGQALV